MIFKRRHLPTILRETVVWGIAFLLLIPFAWMISSSLKSADKVFSTPTTWIPDPIKWENYTAAVKTMPVLLYTRNTIFITMLCILGYILSGSIVAYAFSRIQWKGRDFWFFMMLATMMLPPQVTIIPLYVVFRELQWINTYKPLIVPSFLTGWPFFIFMMRQFFLTIPTELTEAAKIDGAGHFKCYLQIILPLSKPVLATVAIFGFLMHWNDFFGPLIYLVDDSKFTLALGLMTFASKHQTEWSILMAVSIIMLLPTLVVFFFCQKYFVESITLTGTKA